MPGWTTEMDRDRSEGFPRTRYFIPGCDGMGVWPNSEIVPASAAAASFTKIDKIRVKIDYNRVNYAKIE